MSCALAARLDQFERDVVQPLAREELGRRVVRINHLGSFSCRARNGRGDRLSQHGLGRAIDIAYIYTCRLLGYHSVVIIYRPIRRCPMTSRSRPPSARSSRSRPRSGSASGPPS
jgi:hypothetical protein